jgi:hypothetical protein
MSVTKSDFLEDIAVAMESWTDAASKALTDPAVDLVWVEEQEPYRMVQHALANSGVEVDHLKRVFAECLRGFAISVLTALDVGTALAENGRIYLVDEGGKRLGEDLHDDFVSHLLDSGRLPE